jgi:GNAT superfamily N-acetyltransferase
VIRAAAVEDIPRIVAMGERFMSNPDYNGKIAINPERLSGFAKRLIGGEGVLLLNEREGQITGMLGMLVYDHPMSGEKTAVELFWWVNPESRGDGIRLMKRAEQIAIESGAKRMQMVAPNDKVARVYQKFGYEFVESTYQRTL